MNGTFIAKGYMDAEAISDSCSVPKAYWPTYLSNTIYIHSAQHHTLYRHACVTFNIFRGNASKKCGTIGSKRIGIRPI